MSVSQTRLVSSDLADDRVLSCAEDALGVGIGQTPVTGKGVSTGSDDWSRFVDLGLVGKKLKLSRGKSVESKPELQPKPKAQGPMPRRLTADDTSACT